MAGTVLLQTNGLKKSFKGQVAVDRVNMSIEKGDIYGFLGPNGAGKTTTLKLMLGFLVPDDGDILINGTSVVNEKEQVLEKVGAIIETPKFYDGLTGRKNLEIIANLYGRQAMDRIDEVLRIVEMENAADKKVKEYSLGMKQRLGIARAFLNDPEIIILDEPTNGLDPYGMKSIRELIKGLAKKYNKTFIISTHLLNEVEQMCNKVGIIHNGMLIKEFTMSELALEKSDEMSFEDYFIGLTKEERRYA